MPTPLTDEEKRACLKGAVSSLNNARLFLRHVDIDEFDERLIALAADIEQRLQEAEQEAADLDRKDT